MVVGGAALASLEMMLETRRTLVEPPMRDSKDRAPQIMQLEQGRLPSQIASRIAGVFAGRPKIKKEACPVNPGRHQSFLWLDGEVLVATKITRFQLLVAQMAKKFLATEDKGLVW